MVSLAQGNTLRKSAFCSNVYSINVHLLAFIVLCYPHAFASDPLKEAVFIRLRLTLFKNFLVCQEIQESDSQYSEFVFLAVDIITYNDNLTEVVID